MSESRVLYRQILRSSSLVGGAQVVSLLVGLVRTKCVALLIGPVGVGLVGTYQSIQTMVSTVAGLGIRSSAVRDVADAAAKGDAQSLGRTVAALRRVCLVTGAVGAFAMLVLAELISRTTFGNADHVVELALLGIVVLLTNVQGGQSALVQGTRRIGDLAKLNVIGTLGSSVLAIGLYAWLRQRGIIPALLVMGAVNLAVSWWFARNIRIPKVPMAWREAMQAAGSMVRLGFSFMWAGLVGAIVAYATRALITREAGLEAVGIFTAAFNLSGMFINFILEAMAADYYPSLTALAHDRQAMNRHVNQQSEIGLLLAVPGLLATLALAPWVVRILYSAEFLSAAALLHWFVLGCLGRVISWPMGFIMLALGKAGWFALTETATNVLHLALIWLGLRMYGVEGVAMAFAGLYAVHVLAMMGVSSHLTGFRWSVSTRRLLGVTMVFIGIGFLSVRVLPLWPATVVGLGLTALAGVYALRGLAWRLGPGHRLVGMAGRVACLRGVLPLECRPGV